MNFCISKYVFYTSYILKYLYVSIQYDVHHKMTVTLTVGTACCESLNF